MVTPRMRQHPPEGQPWAADTGCYANPAEHDDNRYLMWLSGMPLERCLFATAPDRVGDAVATLELSVPMLPRIRALGIRAALVAQDGLLPWQVPWHLTDALFIGGTTAWKLSEQAFGLILEARRRRLWVHMGRVNSWKRFSAAAAAGCDSADGTVLRFDPSRAVGTWQARALAERGLGL
jgi:hypothetical protein